MTKYYALYDLQLDGFKAGHASEDFQDVVRSGAQRAYDLSQSDEEPIPVDMPDEEILELYGYEVREVTKEEYDIIAESDEIGLTTTVTLP